MVEQPSGASDGVVEAVQGHQDRRVGHAASRRRSAPRTAWSHSLPKWMLWCARPGRRRALARRPPTARSWASTGRGGPPGARRPRRAGCGRRPGRSALQTTASAASRSPPPAPSSAPSSTPVTAPPGPRRMRVTGASVADLDPRLLDRGGEPAGHAVHAALGDEHALDRVHVGDDGVERQRLVRGQPGVHRLEQKIRRRRSSPKYEPTTSGQPAEAAQPHEARAPGASGRARSSTESKLGSMKLRHLDVVEPLEPVAEPVERLGVGRRRRTARISSVIALPAVPDAQLAAVGVHGPVHRVDRADGDEVGHVGARRRERVGQQPGHGQHGRPGVEPVPALGDHRGPPARRTPTARRS